MYVVVHYLYTGMGVRMYCVTVYIHTHYWVCVFSYDSDVILHKRDKYVCDSVLCLQSMVALATGPLHCCA